MSPVSQCLKEYLPVIFASDDPVLVSEDLLRRNPWTLLPLPLPVPRRRVVQNRGSALDRIELALTTTRGKYTVFTIELLHRQSGH